MSFPLNILQDQYATTDELFIALGDLGYVGSINDRVYEYLRDAGFSGSINDCLLSHFNISFTDPTDLTDLVGWWDASDASTFDLDGVNINRWNDKSGNGIDWYDDPTRPTKGTDFVTFAGGQGLYHPNTVTAYAGQRADWFAGIVTTDTGGILWTNRLDNNKFFPIWSASTSTTLGGSLSVGPAFKVLVDGVEYTQRDTLRDAISDGLPHVLEVQDAGFDDWVRIGMCNRVGQEFEGDMYQMVAAQNLLEADRESIRTFIQNKMP